MNFNYVLSKLKLDKETLPKNIFISKKNFFDDISISNLCIYRGSTSVITALQNGVYPIYFNNLEFLNIDPIFALAYSGLADSYAQLFGMLRDTTYRDLGFAAAEKSFSYNDIKQDPVFLYSVDKIFIFGHLKMTQELLQ